MICKQIQLWSPVGLGESDVIWMGKTHFGRVDGGQVSNKEQKRSYKIIGIVSYALKICLTRVLVVYFRSQNSSQLPCLYVSSHTRVYQKK